jgi:hypothetical protein
MKTLAILVYVLANVGTFNKLTLLDGYQPLVELDRRLSVLC